MRGSTTVVRVWSWMGLLLLAGCQLDWGEEGRLGARQQFEDDDERPVEDGEVATTDRVLFSIESHPYGLLTVRAEPPHRMRIASLEQCVPATLPPGPDLVDQVCALDVSIRSWQLSGALSVGPGDEVSVSLRADLVSQPWEDEGDEIVAPSPCSVRWQLAGSRVEGPLDGCALCTAGVELDPATLVRLPEESGCTAEVVDAAGADPLARTLLGLTDPLQFGVVEFEDGLAAGLETVNGETFAASDVASSTPRPLGLYALRTSSEHPVGSPPEPGSDWRWLGWLDGANEQMDEGEWSLTRPADIPFVPSGPGFDCDDFLLWGGPPELDWSCWLEAELDPQLGGEVAVIFTNWLGQEVDRFEYTVEEQR